jgi:hypothetical protein
MADASSPGNGDGVTPRYHKLPPEKREAYVRLRRRGANKSQAAREARISRQAAYDLEARLPPGWLSGRTQTGSLRARVLAEDEVPAPVPLHALTATAARALEDFGFFRRHYLGRARSPWQEDAAGRMLGYLESPHREYVVCNAPPGPGKSTLFTHDLPVWLIVRNRRIRIMVGSRNWQLAAKYAGRIRRTLERRSLAVPPDDQLARGLAVVPEGILVEDFGRFAPARRGDEVWARGAFVVLQEGEETISDKEMTVEAFGFDTTFLGGRYDLVVWDDLVETRTARSTEARAKLAEDYENEAETRLDPGGLLVLQGQRISSHDLYRHSLDQRVPVWWDDPDAAALLERGVDRPAASAPAGPDRLAPANPWESDALVTLDRDTTVELRSGRRVRTGSAAAEEEIAGYRARYHHIVYPAHFEDRCTGQHRTTDPPALDPDRPGGCLLDPRRLPWRELLGHMAQNPLKYRVLYQQEDTDEANVLVRRVWVDGGRDPETGESFPGCVDPERQALPDLAHLSATPRHLWWPPDAPAAVRSFLTLDPSPSRYWALQHWLYDPETSRFWLLDALRRPMTASELLDWNNATQAFTGVLEEWWARSVAAGARVTHLIPEVNVGQKWLLQYNHARAWTQQRSVTVVPHTTGVNKADIDRGVESTQGHWIHGRVRLPYHPTRGKPTADLLVNEALHWPEGMTDDQVMAWWFAALRSSALFPARPPQPVLLRRPTWLRPPEPERNPIFARSN